MQSFQINSWQLIKIWFYAPFQQIVIGWVRWDYKGGKGESKWKNCDIKGRSVCVLVCVRRTVNKAQFGSDSIMWKSWVKVNPIQGFPCRYLNNEGEGILFQSHVKSSKWKSQMAIDALQQSLPAPQCVCLLQHCQYKQTFSCDFFFTFFKILHITPIMLIMIHLGKENSVWVACKEKVGEKNIWSKSSWEAVEIIGAGHRLWCHVVLLLSLAGCDTKTARQARR